MTQSDEEFRVLLEWLIKHGADLDAVSSYGESAVSTLSSHGRFEGVRLFLNAGADPKPLKWTSLIEAVDVGTIDDVRREARSNFLEAVDHHRRTAWLVALLKGDRDKAQLLLDLGANPTPKLERGSPAMFYAIDAGRAELVRWLLDLGQPFNVADEFGSTPLHYAVEHDETECVDVLLDAGADVCAGTGFDSVLAQASSADIVRRAVDDGATGWADHTNRW